MTIAATRACIRGCTIRGEHFAECIDRLGQPTEGCRGCAPAETRDGDMLCARCYGRSLGALYDAPDLVGAIRARANPLKANVYDKVLVSGSLGDGIPAPVAAELIEAADELTRGLQGWAEWARPGSVDGHRGLRAGAEADVAQQLVLESTSVLVDELPRIANDAEQIVELTRYLLDDIPGEWTVRRALAKWPLVDRAWWAAQPCPHCSLRAIRVKPARRLKDDTVYECQGCHWSRTDSDTDGPWPLVFSRRAGTRPV